MWPRRGWRRALHYYGKRLMRMSGSPHSIAAGFAGGVALAMTPLLGFHYLLCFVVAFLVRGNVLAAVIGTTIGNPLTFPFIWLATYETGSLILGWFGRPDTARTAEEIAHSLLNSSLDTLWPIIKPMLIGSIPIGLVAGGLSYVLVYMTVRAFKTSRRERFAIRRRQLHASPP